MIQEDDTPHCNRSFAVIKSQESGMSNYEIIITVCSQI